MISSDGAEATGWPGLHLARREAAARGSSSIGTQHVLLALLSPPDGLPDPALSALRSAGVDLASVGAALEVITGIGGARPAGLSVDEVDTSPRVARILDRAAALREPAGGAARDADVLRALLESDDPSIGRLLVTYVGSPERILAALDSEDTTDDTADERHRQAQGATER